MKNDNLEELIGSLDFDIAEPEGNHQQRFGERLDNASRKNMKTSGVISLWIPWMAIAATFLIGFLLFQGIFNPAPIQQGELASVSPEMEETQNFFASVIQKELYILNQERSPETQAVIKDALNQLDILEIDYNRLKTDLVKSGQDSRVIYAMIANFQKRIDLLNTVLKKVNSINSLKNKSHENNVL